MKIKEIEPMSNNLSVNEFYHQAKEKGLVVNEGVRLMLNQSRSPASGVSVNVMVDYKTKLDSPSGPKHHAYAAVVTFSELNISEINNLINTGIGKFGRSKKGENFVADKLLYRSDIIFLKKDERLLGHPLVKHKIGTVIGEDYEGKDTVMAKSSEIDRSVLAVNMGGYSPSRLDGPIHESWNEKKNDSEFSR